MADCKEIDAALGRLSGKIDSLSGRLNGLEARQKECCDNKDHNPKGDDLSELRKRLDAIEKYINKLDEEIKLITDKVKEIGRFFGDLLDSTDGILGKVFSSITMFTNLFNLFK
jgi:prefoldin subunit 5